MLKKATLICPRCQKAMPDVVLKQSEPFPNKCDVCGSTNVMVTHLIVNIREPSEIREDEEKKKVIEEAAKQGATTMAATLLKKR